MAFSKTPIADTYSSEKIPVTWSMDNWYGVNTLMASHLRGPGMTNLLPFKHQDQSGKEALFAETRFSISSSSTGISGTKIRGVYVWEKTIGTVYYFVVSCSGTTTFICTSTDAVNFTVVNSWATTDSTPARFCEYIDATSVKKLVMLEGTRGYIFTSNAAGTQIVDADFPTPHVPFPVFLDGYLFVAKASTGDIYNSDLNLPDTWTAGNFISSEVYPDDIQALVKVDNYILAIGRDGCEYFYDAANATGSPLARQEGSVLPFGTNTPNSIAYNKNQIMMSANRNDGECIMVLIEGQNYKEIKSAQVFLEGLGPAASVRAYFFRQRGQLFYAVTPNGGTSGAATSTATWCYAVDADMWVELAYGASGQYPIYAAGAGVSASPRTYVGGVLSNTVFFGVLYVSTSADVISAVGANTPIVSLVITTPQTFGTYNRKIMSRLAIDYSYLSPSGTQTVNVSYSDNDYVTWSTDVSLISTNDSTTSVFPFITQLGNFRRRAFRITGTGALTFRYIEVDINKGQQ